MTGSELKQTNSYLYGYMLRRDLLKYIPNGYRIRKFGHDPLLKYYNEYEDLSRKELRKKNNSYYNILARYNLLEYIPINKK